MKRSTLTFIIAVAVIYGGIAGALFILPKFGIHLLPMSRSRASDATSSSVNTIKIPDYFKDPGTLSSEFPNITAAKLDKRVLCSNPLDADTMRGIILHHDFFCRTSRWSADWANPEGKGVRSSGSFLFASDSIITDTLLRVMWQRYPNSGTVPFNQTDSLIHALNTTRWQGYDNWRLPTVEELMSLLVPTKNSNGYYLPDEWPDITQNLWSCNPVADQDEQDHQWVMRPSHGRCNFGDRNIARSLVAIRDL